MPTQPNNNSTSTVAVLGFCIPMMESLDKANKPFVAVVPSEFEAYMVEHDIPYVLWDFNKYNEKSGDLYEQLKAKHATVAVPLYEETVNWAGALNSHFRDDPRLFNRYHLFRDKAMMKRKAQMSGIQVGVFEEADDADDVRRFLRRVNEAELKLEGEAEEPIHIKPKDAAGSLGHKLIRSLKDIDELTEEDFPTLMESHLDGQEFSCEVFIHKGKIRFLNITEYIHLGYTNFVPASPVLEAKRPLIEEAVQQLIDAFGIEYGMIHPEFFINSKDKISFGEVAARIPGGHIFELIEKGWGFDPMLAFVLCSDPNTSEDVLDNFFPKSYDDRKTFAGCVMVYPQHKMVTNINVPETLLNDPYYEKHNLFVPVSPKVADRVAFGDHYGTVFFNGDDSERMRDLLNTYEKVDFYVAPTPENSAQEVVLSGGGAP